MTAFTKKYPKVNLLKNKLFVIDKNIYSSAGVAAGIDMALHIIELELGVKESIEVAKQMVVYFRRGEDDAQINAFLNYRNHMDSRIHRAQSFITNNLNAAKLNIVDSTVFIILKHLLKNIRKTTNFLFF